MGIEYAFVTDRGKRKLNQDSLICMEAKTLAGDVLFAVVCDGMGGPPKGELASAVAVRAFARWFSEELPVIIKDGIHEDKFFGSWKTVISEIEGKLSSYGVRNGLELGTTLSGILIIGTDYYIVHVGDSRVYAVTDGGISCLTKDHTYVMRKVEEGKIRLEDMEKDRGRSVLTQCIGSERECSPDFSSGKVLNDTVFVVCSDGFRHLQSNQEIQKRLCPKKQKSQKEISKNLEKIIKILLQRGERDNITAIAIRKDGYL